MGILTNTVGHIKPKCFKFIEYCNIGNASKDREIELRFKHAKAFEYGKNDNVTKHVKNVWNVKNANLAKIDRVCVASNVEKISINDILVHQVVEEIYSRFNIVVNKNLDDVCVGSPKTKFVKVLIEHIEIAACATRLDKKLAFPRFISHLCLAKGLKRQDEDVLLPPLENFSEKRMATMSYKEKGKSSDTFRLFSESHDSSHVSSTPSSKLGYTIEE
ncbi:hypothetical protein LWI29_033434 [Acer saccharum]|uniref:Uncharacterized protein n=1 Tax=Acer saccharum TaxID=4024 RepID=A0AA39VEF5_ACESA|nr:hypothetical protein LWI29_033434 [Acer saccharum]